MTPKASLMFASAVVVKDLIFPPQFFATVRLGTSSSVCSFSHMYFKTDMTFSATVAREMSRMINKRNEVDEGSGDERSHAQRHGTIQNNTYFTMHAYLKAGSKEHSLKRSCFLPALQGHIARIVTTR